MEQVKEECCPTFHPEKWEEKTFNWDYKKFIKASVPTLFHMPLSPMIGKKITKMMKLAEEAQKLSKDKEDILLLFMDSNPIFSYPLPIPYPMQRIQHYPEPLSVKFLMDLLMQFPNSRSRWILTWTSPEKRQKTIMCIMPIVQNVQKKRDIIIWCCLPR